MIKNLKIWVKVIYQGYIYEPKKIRVEYLWTKKNKGRYLGNKKIKGNLLLPGKSIKNNYTSLLV